jgi:SMI1 / KNR4 family (SUKH-1)
MNLLEILADLHLAPIFDSYQSLDDSDLAEIEQIIEQKLPESLLLLFRNYGCAGFKRATDYVSTDSEFPISYILGAGESSYAVVQVMRDIEEEGILKSIPFAGDEFGNIYFCRLDSEMSGVWRWNHEEDLTPGENPILLAHDLEQFFSALRSEE